MADKKIVKYKALLGFQEHSTGAVQALLEGVEDHYRLGNAPRVITSAVIRIQYPADTNWNTMQRREPIEIETLNTIYQRK